MQLKHIFIWLFPVLITLGCASSTTTTTTGNYLGSKIVKIAPFKGECQDNSNQDCLYIQVSHEEVYHSFTKTIEGFNFEEGYFYIMRVKEYKQRDSLTTNNDLHTVLDKIILKKPNNIGPDNFSNKKWELYKLHDKEAPEYNIPWFSLDFEKNRINGNGGCNGFFGGFELNGSEFKGSKLGATQMFCNDASPLETEVLQLLQQKSNIYILEDQLIFTQNGTIAASFKLAQNEDSTN